MTDSEETYEELKTFRPNDVWPKMWKHMSYAAKKRQKQRWTIEKPKFHNDKQLKGFFLNQMMMNSSSMKAARMKLEVLKPAAIPKIPTKSSG